MSERLLGRQTPRIESVPPGVENPDCDAALELVAAAGVDLFPWQQHVLRQSLRRRGGQWAAFNVGLVCPRQNGKNEILLARELAGLFLFGERLIMHTAHEANTANEAFRRLVSVIEANDWLRRELKGRPHWSRGNEGLELKSGQRIQFKTRTAGGGRGFSGALLLFDEAMILPDSFLQATLPTLTAYPDPQIWFTGSAVDQRVHSEGDVLTRIRQHGLAGDDDDTAFFEWSAEFDGPDDVSDDEAADPLVWADANPSLGYMITEKYIARELASPMDLHAFLAERLGVVVWPTLSEDGAVISVDAWRALADRDSSATDPVCLAVDVSPNGVSAAICAAGARPGDSLMHGEVVEHRRGTDWVPGRLAELVRAHEPLAVLYAQNSPASALVPAIEALDVELTPVTTPEHAQACGMLQTAVDDATVRHLGSNEIVAALRGAAQRPLGDAWAWARTKSTVDITPLVSFTLAHWGAITIPVHKEPILLWR